MPALEEATIKDLEARLCRHLERLGGYGKPKFVNAGGSAAVFGVQCEDQLRAIKVFSPELFGRPQGAAERRRLDVQRRLIGHPCKSLIQTYGAEEAEGTAFIEMEFIQWPQLKDTLARIPDDAVVPLITQLVDAVKYLESQNIVHRDIKPENIHVSEDFTKLKLLDLGVAREFELREQDLVAATDHGLARPFLATAQYSSPEYLFRLDEPTGRLWRGLNFYQIGAVLHDLIMKVPIFEHEIALGNRWLLAKAVLTQPPSFVDATPNRMRPLKALASRCLVKDLENRLRLVGWDDFILEGAKDPLIALRVRLAKGPVGGGRSASDSSMARLVFDREEFVKRFTHSVRSELIAICGTQLPLALQTSAPGEPPCVAFRLSVNKEMTIVCRVEFEWLEELYQRSAKVVLFAQLVRSSTASEPAAADAHLICIANIGDGEEDAVMSLSNEIAIVAEAALDLIEATEEVATLHGVDLAKRRK
jgi:serine/threonine-protein kinase